MRVAFTTTLLKEIKRNKNIMLLSADMGYSIFEQFRDNQPNQFLNAGISEQNMTSLAAGLAIEGKIPVIYSIIPFITMRNFEQIRNDICYQNLNVKIVGVGSGFSYGSLGYSHFGIEDIGILRTLPNLIILSPCDPIETVSAMKWALRHNGPVYIRLGKAGEPNLTTNANKFKIGSGNILKEGNKISILATGAITSLALSVAQKLETKGYSTKVVSMVTIKPIDKELIVKLTHTMKGIFTLEEHSVMGGLGSAVAEVLAENPTQVVFKRFGTADSIAKKSGNQEYMRKINGLSNNTLVKQILNHLNAYA